MRMRIIGHALLGSLAFAAIGCDRFPAVIVGSDAEGTGSVRTFNGLTQQLQNQRNPNGNGSVRVAAGDVNGDGTLDTILGFGPGVSSNVMVQSGKDQSLLASFLAFGPSYTGGVFVAAGDVNGDGRADIIVGTDSGVSGQVSVFDGVSFQLLANFFAYGGDFKGGVRVAAGDINGDGKADIITGAGPGSGPHVKVFSGADQSTLASFFAYDGGFTGGVFVAAGDLSGDGHAEIVVGPGSGSSNVRAYDGATLQLRNSFFAYDPAFTGGVRVAVVDVNADGTQDIVTGPGPGGDGNIRAFSGVDASQVASFFAFNAGFSGGIFVAGGPLTTNSGRSPL